MHDWSEEEFDWAGLNDAGHFIGDWLRTWVRMEIRDVKEKFGTLRIYCGFGWQNIYAIWRPGYMWVHKWWPYRLDSAVSRVIMPLLNKVVVPMQARAYRTRYELAVERWPHLKQEILCCADYPELLKEI